jgi:hypothetical protein
MNKSEIVALILVEAKILCDRPLPYLLGGNSVTVKSVVNGCVYIIKSDGNNSPEPIGIDAIEKYADKLASGSPVHVTDAFVDSYNHKSALEALVAHMSHAGHCLKLESDSKPKKRVIWFDVAIKKHSGVLLDVTDDWKEKMGRRSGRFHDSPISRALLSKPFLILTGPSGTGKTRGAIRLAEALCGPGFKEDL